MTQHLHIKHRSLLCYPYNQLPTVVITRSTQTHTKTCNLIFLTLSPCPHSSKPAILPKYSFWERPPPHTLTQHENVNCDNSLSLSFIWPVIKFNHLFLISAPKSIHSYNQILVQFTILCQWPPNWSICDHSHSCLICSIGCRTSVGPILYLQPQPHFISHSLLSLL